jgi:hypothetical protein
VKKANTGQKPMEDLKETVSSVQLVSNVMKVKKTEVLPAQKRTTAPLETPNFVLLVPMVQTKLEKFHLINVYLVLQETTALMALLSQQMQDITHLKLVLPFLMHFTNALLDSTVLAQETQSTKDVLVPLATIAQQEPQNTSMLITSALKEHGVTG